MRERAAGTRDRAAGTRDRAAGTRAQSEVLGVVLLLGITIVGTGLIVAFGSSALDDSKRASEIDSAENAMTQLDSKASLVGIGASPVQRTSLGVDSVSVENRSGWMRVRVNPMDVNEPERTVMNQSLGAVTYRNADTAIAYQGGGVWKRTGNGTTMVSPPEVHYRDTTLTLPLVAVSGRGPLDGTAVVRKNGTGDPKYPRPTNGMSNPLTRAEVNLTVQSEYYRAWGRFFEQRTGGEVKFDHDNRSVTLRLITPPNVPKVKQGVASTSSKKLNIHGGGGEETFTDSYNSSVGPYTESKNQSGTIETVGGVSMSGDAEIRGNLVSGGGVVEIKSSKTRVEGNVSYGGSFSLSGQATVTGWVANNGSVADIDPVGPMVTARNDSIHDSNDNGATGAISNGRLVGCSSTCELTAGKYYLEEIDIDNGEELVVNLSDGNVALAVSGPISVDGGTIRVENPSGGRTNVYMDATKFEVVGGGEVRIPGQKSGSFRVYGPPGVEAEFSDSRFVGMLYAPDSPSVQGSVAVTTHAKVFGALVGGETRMKSGGTVHYDAALARSTTLPQNYQTAPRVTYMHVTVNRVNVTSV
ncbi:hypothetical protein M0R89_13740 [Halorussus limi]|uniref:DUF7305 domain-containing protein n=1 Tax=Halorussus limi TaxID=2938695 RepID=A0A8U0HSC1_9EURY|nr:archaellin/type IV pilin N-terminal domain-containing protein [Halorussus limi]UPV73596.1 hypothetical protein M0R89_13740 [Halorussus limi]